jgi:hypothetical protein
MVTMFVDLGSHSKQNANTTTLLTFMALNAACSERELFPMEKLTEGLMVPPASHIMIKPLPSSVNFFMSSSNSLLISTGLTFSQVGFSGCPNQEIGRPFLFKGLKIRIFPCLGARILPPKQILQKTCLWNQGYYSVWVKYSTLKIVAEEVAVILV